MSIRAVLFDLYGTLIHIETDESQGEIYWAIARYLSYHRIRIDADALRERYFELAKRQKRDSGERYPEMDARAVWRAILSDGTRHYRPEAFAGEGPDKQREVEKRRERLARELVRLQRALSRRQIERYPGAKHLLQSIAADYRLGIVSDAQHDFARAEMRITKLRKYFPVKTISDEFGYRKPDPRLFQQTCAALEVLPEETIYVGNDMYRDIYGAHQAGLRTILVWSDQGRKEYRDTRADYDARDLFQVLEGIRFLAAQ
ncbi:HAD family hydrolase [Acidihalobacter ferrooxydans]|uniref:HAD family hydrolase n=1 Tax=Acidihalobacter ferrooxydans TaxID=1765967 RepID=A0A1P8UG93_9GAMM|nr:HAD family hydrolase [Acidihalobacter ferrooxydans]APZ42835.1 HAD family hydrolase [Acidihalobacter ferrooxydans]